jgi:hypothetical protein
MRLHEAAGDAVVAVVAVVVEQRPSRSPLLEPLMAAADLYETV